MTFPACGRFSRLVLRQVICDPEFSSILAYGHLDRPTFIKADHRGFSEMGECSSNGGDSAQVGVRTGYLRTARSEFPNPTRARGCRGRRMKMCCLVCWSRAENRVNACHTSEIRRSVQVSRFDCWCRKEGFPGRAFVAMGSTWCRGKRHS